jgi:uncharacterized protein YegP (UPF0339 family)
MGNYLRLGGSLAACWLVAALAVLLGGGPAPAQKDKDSDKHGKLTFEIYKDRGGEYRWRLKAANGKILAVPEDAYKSHAGAKEAVENIRKHAGDKKWKVEYYQDRAKEHRWRLKAANGAVMARSSEGYKTKEGAEKALGVVRHGVKEAAVVDKK